MKRRRLNYILGKKLTQFCKIPATTLKGKIIRYTSGNNKGQVKYRYVKNPEELHAYYGSFIDEALKDAKLDLQDSDDLQNKVDKAQSQIINKQKENAEKRRQIRQNRKKKKEQYTNEIIQAKIEKGVKDHLAKLKAQKHKNDSNDQNNNDDINNNQD